MILNDFIPKVPKVKRQTRDFSNFDKTAFNNDVSKIQLLSLVHFDININTIYDQFHNEFLDLIEKHAPMKTLSIKDTKWQLKPWITKGIQKSIAKKDILYKKFLKSKKSFWYKRYSIYRNKTKQLIFYSKRNCYVRYFEKFEKDSKKVWSGISTIINKKSKINFYQ